jgi:serine phosphatase RsbU (regulator of sigma subunit)
MGRIRPALRAYVLDGHGPAEALERLDRLMKESAVPNMATVFHLHYDPKSGSARYVRAGHPPALLCHADGQIQELGGPGTPPLGVLEEVEYREHEVEIPAESLLLMFTDGLIERRGTSVREELDRLEEMIGQAPRTARACLDWLEENLGADSVPDDIAMVAMSTPAA